jgi:hypothetical protein
MYLLDFSYSFPLSVFPQIIFPSFTCHCLTSPPAPFPQNLSDPTGGLKMLSPHCHWIHLVFSNGFICTTSLKLLLVVVLMTTNFMVSIKKINFMLFFEYLTGTCGIFSTTGPHFSTFAQCRESLMGELWLYLQTLCQFLRCTFLLGTFQEPQASTWASAILWPPNSNTDLCIASPNSELILRLLNTISVGISVNKLS